MFKNQHLSYSRLSRFETCPLSFKIHYIEKLKGQATLPLIFGKAVHHVLECLVRDHMYDEKTGSLDGDRASDLWQKACIVHQLTDQALFSEGLEIINKYIERQGPLDHMQVLAVEQEFRLPVGPFTVLGYIDRIDRVDNDTVEIIDYKTNRVLFSREDVDTSLQMSLYELAVRRMYPWAKHVRLVFEMLRHDCRMVTTRTEDDLESAAAYAETLGHMTETATNYDPRLNSNCIYCDHKSQCPAYADALAGKRSIICEDLADLEAVAAEREEVAKLAKILYDRKRELEEVIKTHLEVAGEAELAGKVYRLREYITRHYPVDETVARVTLAMPDVELAEIVDVKTKAVDALLARLRKSDKAAAAMLRAELEAVCQYKKNQRLT